MITLSKLKKGLNMTLKQIQRIALKRCNPNAYDVDYLSEDYFKSVKPDFSDLRMLRYNYLKSEIRKFFTAKHAVFYYTNNDGRGVWLNTRGEELFIGF